MLADVVPRMTSLGDARFLTRLTGRVQEWLDAAGSGEDDAAVARTWMQLAVNEDYLSHPQEAERFAQRCLAVAHGLQSARERYALEMTCEAMRVDNSSMPEGDRAARIAALWRQPPPPDALDDARTVEARQRLAARRFVYANGGADPVEELAASRESLALSQRWQELEPDEPAAQLGRVDALVNASIAACNQLDGVAALNYASEAVKRARALLALSPTQQALGRLADALFTQVQTRRWFSHDDPAARGRLEDEARAAHEAMSVLASGSVRATVGMLALLLETADLERIPAVLAGTRAAQFGEDSRTIWLYAMLVTGRSREGLESREWLGDTQNLDLWVVFALMAADTGDWRQAATWAREATKRSMASVWMIDGLHRWASGLTGPGATAIQHFETAMSAAQKKNDDAAHRLALEQFAGEMEQLATVH